MIVVEDAIFVVALLLMLILGILLTFFFTYEAPRTIRVEGEVRYPEHGCRDCVYRLVPNTQPPCLGCLPGYHHWIGQEYVDDSVPPM